jgi:hypothetical protein
MIDSKLFIDKNKTVMYGVFENPDKFLETVGKVHHKGAHIIDCYTPYPLHGIEKAMGLKRSLLPVGAFLFGCTGFLTAFSLQFYMMRYDWPMVIGNKPTIGMSWIPVLFEMTILFTAFGLAFIFFFRSKMLHGKIPSERFDMRQTDDRMVIAVATDDKSIDRSELSNMLFDGGAVEVKERTNHDYDDFTDVEMKRI